MGHVFYESSGLLKDFDEKPDRDLWSNLAEDHKVSNWVTVKVLEIVV